MIRTSRSSVLTPFLQGSPILATEEQPSGFHKLVLLRDFWEMGNYVGDTRASQNLML
jgi:hypothetical protein